VSGGGRKLPLSKCEMRRKDEMNGEREKVYGYYSLSLSPLLWGINNFNFDKQKLLFLRKLIGH